MAECAGLVAINVVGVLLCFDANRRGDNVEFLNRVVCLSLPLSIRFLALAVPLLVVVGVLGAMFEGTRTPVAGAAWMPVQLHDDGSRRELELVGQGLGLVLNAAYYWRLRVHLRWIAAVPSQ